MIALICDSSLTRDGLGAQLQRQIATFCLAKYFRVEFQASEIVSMDFNPGDGINDIQVQRDLIFKVNQGLKRNSTFSNRTTEFKRIGNLKAPTKIWKLRVWFVLLRLDSIFRTKDLVIDIGDPYIYINQKSSLYRKGNKFHIDLPNQDNNSTKKLNVSMQIPRAKVSADQLSERFQPTEWYVSTLSNILEILGVEKSEVCLSIHTDAPSHPQEWAHAGKSSAETLQYWEKAGLLDQSGVMKLNYENFVLSFKDFNEVEVIRDISPIEAWAQIANSDIFIMGKSSFSFVGAFFNRRGLIISPKFFIPPLPNWLLVGNESYISKSNKFKIRYAQLNSTGILGSDRSWKYKL